MQIAVAALIFRLRSLESLQDRRRQLLHFLIKRLRIVYIPGLSGKLPRDSDLAEASAHLAVNTRHSKLQSDEAKFNELIQNVNFILYYLSNVEVERAHQESQGISDLQEPIQIMWASQYSEWMFNDDFERRMHGDKVGRHVNDSITGGNFESQSQYFKHSTVSG